MDIIFDKETLVGAGIGIIGIAYILLPRKNSSPPQEIKRSKNRVEGTILNKSNLSDPIVFKKEVSNYFMSNLPDISNKTLAERFKSSTKLNYDQVVLSPSDATSFCIQNK